MIGTPTRQGNIPNEGWEPISWENGSSLLQRSVLVEETIMLMQAGYTNADRIRDRIRRKFKLSVQKASAHPNRDPSSKFVNEHAFALKELVEHAIITTKDEKEYSLAPHARDALPVLLKYLRAGEPRPWIPSGGE